MVSERIHATYSNLNVDYTVTQHKSLLQKVKGWKDADITKFLTSLHHLRKTIKNSDDHLLKVFQKKLQQNHYTKMPDEEELKTREIVRQWLDNLIGEVERTAHGDDETKTNSFVAEKSMLGKKSKHEEAENIFKKLGTDKRKKLLKYSNSLIPLEMVWLMSMSLRKF